MVTKILKYSASSATPLEYNERKCVEGVAKIVQVVNIADDSMYSVKSALLHREANPAISARTRKMGFHMSVNPGPNDDIDEDGVLGYIRESMEGLGFGEQPYAVYLHKDIERKHYHVVSTRVDECGKIINDSFSRVRLQKLQDRLAKKYGFSVGLIDENNITKVKAGELEKGMKNLLPKMRANIELALEVGPRNEREFRCILRVLKMDMNQGMFTGRDGKTHKYVSFAGKGHKGESLTRPIPAKRVLGPNYGEILAGINGYVIGRETKERSLIERINEAMKSANSVQDFRGRLYRDKIGLFFFDAAMNPTETRNDFTSALVIDFKNQCCLTIDSGLLARILALDDAASKKKKAAETKKRPAVSYTTKHKIH